jgi:plasmid stabilization system protein ParE
LPTAYHELRTQIEALLDQPALGRRGHQRGTRYLIVRVGTNIYRCLYRVSGQRIIVVRVRDTRQEGASPQWELMWGE